MKNILLWLILLAFVFSAKAQNATLAPSAAAEKTVPLIFEKAYLHTDRDVYAQGDTLWFKAYLTNAQDNKPIASSGNLYVELLAPDSAKIINREIIRLENGSGNGDMELIDSLPSGKYRLRAYTNWMRNFGDNFVFQKNITILNVKAAPIAPDPKAAKTKQKSKKIAITATATAPTATAPLATPIVRFYPEGGSMVEGISSIVGVKAEDGYGTGIPAKGAVLSSGGDTVARFTCDDLGMGLLILLPIKGQAYHAVVNPVAGGVSFQSGSLYTLPAALSKGLTLQIRQTDSVIRAIIRRSEDTTNSAVKPSYIIAVKHGGKTLLNQQLQLQSAQASASIATALLPEGISAITLYDDLGKPACERLVYVHHPGSSNAIIKTDKKNYQPKEKAEVQISAPANSNLSMAVVDADIVPEQAEDIAAYLMLRSEIKGNIENAGQYFDTTNVNRFKQLNMLLLTQGWRDFVWRRLADTAIHISYPAEEGISVPGQVRDEVLNKMMPNLNLFLHADGARGIKQFSTRSDSLGRFHFDGLMLYGRQLIKLTSVNDRGQNRGVITIDTVLPLPVKQKITTIQGGHNNLVATIAMEKRTELIKTSKINGITRLKEVTISDKRNKNAVVILADGNAYTPWGGDKIFAITPNDYELKTLSWFLLHKNTGAYQDARYGIYFIGDGHLKFPVLFINGNQLHGVDRDLYFDMPIEKFKKVEIKEVVEVAPQNKILPPQLLYLLYLTLKDNYLTDNPGFLDNIVPGYYEARAFYEPPPNAKPSLADYRTTIHWEPNIKTDATGKANINFYNAMPQTNVRVVVQGITADGKPVTAVTTYNVKQVN